MVKSSLNEIHGPAGKQGGGDGGGGVTPPAPTPFYQNSGQIFLHLGYLLHGILRYENELYPEA